MAAYHVAVMKTYTVEVKRPEMLWLHNQAGTVGILEQRATGWVARPCEAGRRASTKRWETAEAAARSMWGREAALAVRDAIAKAGDEDEPEPWDGPDFCGSGT